MKNFVLALGITVLTCSISFAEDLYDYSLPCPSFWSVQPNPSVENSLSYIHDNGDIAVTVTYVAGSAGNVGAQAYSRVAAEQLKCDMPVRSNLIEDAWSFYCSDIGVEGVVYGDAGDLVLLSISGRNDKTEPALEYFVRFLADQAKR
ncbi:hypothetical protein [Succinatimonas hippei]|uniref:hypothetical protein n=1 Tax=Succinatimonas hippei TaxID=626938 RepID=UPI0023F8A915|nr:hypothetical protein [Succinatimonas hippei]